MSASVLAGMYSNPLTLFVGWEDGMVNQGIRSRSNFCTMQGGRAMV